MNFFLKLLLTQAINFLEKVIMEYVKNTPDAWDDAIAIQLIAFLRNFVNGTKEQQQAAFQALKDANVIGAHGPAKP